MIITKMTDKLTFCKRYFYDHSRFDYKIFFVIVFYTIERAGIIIITLAL